MNMIWKNCLLVLFVIFLVSWKKEKKYNQASSYEKKIDSLLAKMTLEEKVGQMTQITLDIVCKGEPFDENKKQEIDPQKLENALLKYHVGSILNTGTHSM